MKQLVQVPYETNDTAGAIDITKRHHFISGGVNYTLADGTYIGQELHFWRSATGSGYSDITMLMLNGLYQVILQMQELTAFGEQTVLMRQIIEHLWLYGMALRWCLSGGTVVLVNPYKYY